MVVVLFSLYEQDVRNSLTRFLFIISVWTGRNSGLEDDKDPRLLELADEGIVIDDDEEADEAMEDGRESESLMAGLCSALSISMTSSVLAV